MNVCTKFGANPSCRCCNISLNVWKLWSAVVARSTITVSPNSFAFIWGPWMSKISQQCIHYFLRYLVEIGVLNNIAMPRVMLLVWQQLWPYSMQGRKGRVYKLKKKKKDKYKGILWVWSVIRWQRFSKKKALWKYIVQKKEESSGPPD